MKNYNISGSIVVYNKPEDAVKTVESVIANTGDNFSLYVIDNNSRDKINDILRGRFNRNYIDLKENIGFGKAHNKVLPLVNSKYHFVINPDILINKDTIDALCDFYGQPPGGCHCLP